MGWPGRGGGARGSGKLFLLRICFQNYKKKSFFTKSPNLQAKFFSAGWRGGGDGGARVRELFSQRIQT